MTVEEKAKAYDEALEQAKFYHGNCPSEPERKKLEKMFPVLHESEDERMYKAICSIISEHYDRLIGYQVCSERKAEFEQERDKILIYLEKQKNKNLIELTENVELGLDRALMIVKDAKGVLPGYQSDDGIYECNHAIETLENILKTIQ